MRRLEEEHMKRRRNGRHAALALAGAMLGLSGEAAAAGFALIEQNASGLGNAYAGAAAVGDDASTIFFNPAGLTRLSGQQVLFAAHSIWPSANFNNTGSSLNPTKRLGGESGDAGEWALVPNFYYAAELAPDWRAGLGINAPFGLKTRYDPTWMGRFHAIDSDLVTLNINPTLAYRVNDWFSIGVGFDLQYITAKLTRAVNFGPRAGEGSVKVNGDDWSFGGNIGALFQLTPSTRLGIAYRSNVGHHLTGEAKFVRPPPVPNLGPVANGPVIADVTMPENVSVSLVSDVTSDWQLLADVTWTGWSRFQQLNIFRSDTGQLLSSNAERWNDTFRYSVGASYRYDQSWKFRGGFAYDQTPVPDKFRTARIPDNDRVWLTIGANYKLTNRDSFDIGYAHIFLDDSPIRDLQGNGFADNGNLIGTYRNSIDILSVQYVRLF
jgi:long-chain fatty acid transport protein